MTKKYETYKSDKLINFYLLNEQEYKFVIIECSLR